MFARRWWEIFDRSNNTTKKMAKKKGKLFRVVFYIWAFGAIYLGYDMAFNMGEKYLYSKFVDITENAPGKVRNIVD